MAFWQELWKIFGYEGEKDPLAKRKDAAGRGAGVASPDGHGSLNADEPSGGGTGLRQSYEMIDTTTLNSRITRYKEYDRLRAVPEIETAMTVLADEACVVGDTRIATPIGFQTIRSLAKTYTNPQERFLVYAWDFDANDYALGWAFHPRLVKKEKTVRVILDDGSTFTVTPDHRVLDAAGQWREAGTLQNGDELKPFYRITPEFRVTNQVTRQFPRIFTFRKGWMHERQFVDEWRTGEDDPRYAKFTPVARMAAQGISLNRIARHFAITPPAIALRLKQEGFSAAELKLLGHKRTSRRVVSIQPGPLTDVYDLSVEKHQCFCTDSVVMHNCQKDDKGNVFNVIARNESVRTEVEFLLRHRKRLNLNRYAWVWFKNLCVFGDVFAEVIIDPENPKLGVCNVKCLPQETMYRIETTKGRLVEFQQSKEGADYQALLRAPTPDSRDPGSSTAIRFHPRQIVHFRLGDDRKTFYPYGQSLIEPARGPAHSLRIMEDALVVYRLCLVGDTRVRTDTGWKYIKDIQEGDKVWCMTNKGQQLTKVTWSVCNGTKKVYRARSRHAEIIGTETHPVLVQEEGVRKYVELSKLTPKRHRLINAKRPSVIQNQPLAALRFDGEENKVAKLSPVQRAEFRNKKYENVTELMRRCGDPMRIRQFFYAKGKCLPLRQAQEIASVFGLDPDALIVCNKCEINPERIRLPEYVTEEFARLFGFMLGDGSVRKNSISFAAGADWSVNEKYRSLLEKFFTEVRFNKDKRSRLGLGAYVVASTTAAKVFKKLGYIPGAKNKRIPDWVFTSSKEVQEAVVRGISDADGCERYTPAGLWYSSIKLCNKALVEDIKEIWQGLGYATGHISYRHRVTNRLIDGHPIAPVDSWRVTISEQVLPEYESVMTVDEAGSELVYDIGVEHDCHNFIANGIPVHNSRAPERRVFYIDVGQLPPGKAESYVERLKDQYRKRKIAQARGQTGANQVEERWTPPAIDEDIWLPVRPNTGTKIDTLPGAQNLGEVSDLKFLQLKLYTALNFPANFFANEDAASTRITLSSQNAQFAMMVERLQSVFEDGLLEIAERHLELRGYPPEEYEDLAIHMTPPSAWREMSMMEVKNGQIGLATQLKSSLLMADFDILTRILKYEEQDARGIETRTKIQKLDDLKLNVLAQNPQLLGVGIPGQDPHPGPEMGAEPGGPGLNPTPDGQQPPPDQQPPPQEDKPHEPKPEPAELPEADPKDIKRFDMEIQSYEDDMDREERDES